MQKFLQWHLNHNIFTHLLSRPMIYLFDPVHIPVPAFMALSQQDILGEQFNENFIWQTDIQTYKHLSIYEFDWFFLSRLYEYMYGVMLFLFFAYCVRVYVGV